MFKKIISILIIPPIFIILFFFIIANSESVKLTFNILHPRLNSYSFTAPFFLWIIIFILIGILIEKLFCWYTKKRKYKF